MRRSAIKADKQNKKEPHTLLDSRCTHHTTQRDSHMEKRAAAALSPAGRESVPPDLAWNRASERYTLVNYW